MSLEGIQELQVHMEKRKVGETFNLNPVLLLRDENIEIYRCHHS